tara:strand:+ start:39 stop:299 length:261 start_codon:yes stop_codon:yes gene_type:complete
MKTELKYLFYVATIIGFIIFVSSYYFSDKNKKYSYRSITLYDEKLFMYKNRLKNLKSDTQIIIKNVENDLNKDKKKYNFMKLFSNE